MNTTIKANGLTIEISEGLNDVFVKVVNKNDEVISDTRYNNDMPSINVDESDDINSVSKKVDMDEYSDKLRAIGDRLNYLDNVVYSAYTFDKNGLPVDNLDELAIAGEAKISYDVASSDDKFFKPVVITNATWENLTHIAEDAIVATGDYHHQFFEGVRWDKKNCTYQLVMGS